MELATLLGALSVDGARESTMNKIVYAGFHTYESIIAADPSDLSKIPGIKDQAFKIHASLVERAPIIEKLLDHVKIKERVVGSLTGKNFLFTGSVTDINPLTNSRFKRKELETMVKNQGGQIASGVSKTLNYLVQSDPTSSSKKSVKAQFLGVSRISIKDFLDLVNE